MEAITKLMINEFKIMESGIDFMGYSVINPKKLSFHHLIIPKREGGKATIENGAILTRSAHDYLHVIERTERNFFLEITKEMIEENKKHFIDMKNIKIINEILTEFEEKHFEDTLKKGKLLIKEEYRNRLLQGIR